MSPLLVLYSLVACVPTSAVDAASAEDEPKEEEEEPPPSLDAMVNSYIPQNYAPEEVARVVFVGDSITAGTGATNRNLPYTKLLRENDDDTWPTATELDFTGIYGEEPEVIDEALGGATTASLVTKQLPHVTEALGDTVSGVTAVVVTIAGNDVQALIAQPSKTEETAEKIVANLSDFYDYFEDPVRFPDGSVIFLANVYEPSDGVGQYDDCFYGLNLVEVLESLDYINEATLAQAKERNVAWIDMRGHFLGHGFYAEDTENPYHHPDDPSVWFDDDCIHPNDRGHHEIRRLMWYALAGESFPGDEAASED
jgi:hypothetical protein